MYEFELIWKNSFGDVIARERFQRSESTAFAAGTDLMKLLSKEWFTFLPGDTIECVEL